MKIGFYGNANNYPFMLALALQRMGHEIVFIVSSRVALNRPEFRYGAISQPYPSWIHDLSSRFRWLSLVPGPTRRKIIRLINSCDFAILNEEGPTLARGLIIPFLSLLTGSDLEVFADPTKAVTLAPQLFHQPKWLQKVCREIFPSAIIRHWLTWPQREGIRRARLVSYFARGQVPTGDRVLDEIGVPDKRRIFLLMADTEINFYAPPSQNGLVRIFCLARLTWKQEVNSGLTSLDYKGSDVMIRGLSAFYSKHRVRLNIRLVRKGRHVAETEQLLSELGIVDQVTWLNELTQAEVRNEYRAADIIFDQLGEGIVAMGGLEAMATGRPLIANARLEVTGAVLGESCPICQARTAEEVCHQLERLVPSAKERLRVGMESHRYVLDRFSTDAAAKRLMTAWANPQ